MAGEVLAVSQVQDWKKAIRKAEKHGHAHHSKTKALLILCPQTQTKLLTESQDPAGVKISV
jgi:hypothetical protein